MTTKVQDLFDLTGQVALVTGGSRGLGLQIAEALGDAGAKIMLTSRKAADLEEATAHLQARGIDARWIAADAAKPEEAHRVVAETIERLGQIDILVNNAGITRDDLIMRMELEAWREVIDTNLSGAFYATKAVTRPMLRAKWGRIINITSVVGLMGNKGQANYAASKAGLVGLTKSVAKELGSRNILCNAVAPGFIETDMTVAVVNAAGDEIKKKIPVRRLGRPDDIAGAVMFFAADESSYVTGQVLKVDGGLTLGGL